MTRPTVLACGMGVNTTGVIVEKVRRRERIDALLFGDTGGEFAWVYAAIPALSEWLVSQGYPPITVLKHTRADGSVETLEEECVRTKRLPSIAYGSSKRCSGKYKLEPQDKFLNHWQPAKQTWRERERVIKLIGYDIDERHRMDHGDAWNNEKYLGMWREGMSIMDIARHELGLSRDNVALLREPATRKALRSVARKVTATVRYEKQYPLVEWGWGRDECLAAIDAAGLPRPGKTACFFCPSSKLHEIRALPPELRDRALAMEDGAQDGLTSVRGLGRSFAWRDVFDPRQQSLSFPEPPSMPCVCDDGESDDEAEIDRAFNRVARAVIRNLGEQADRLDAAIDELAEEDGAA